MNKRLVICYGYPSEDYNFNEVTPFPFIDDATHREYYGKHVVTQATLLDVLYRWGHDGSKDITVSRRSRRDSF